MELFLNLISFSFLNHPCVFPFKYTRKTFWTCIDKSDPEGRFWCSTKVDKTGKHIGGSGEWGYCPEGCTDTITAVRGGDIGM